MTLVGQTRDHLCHCGRWGAFGHGMFPGREGTWFCGEHNPQKLDYTPQPVIVRLSEVWLARAIEIGKARNDYGNANGMKNRGKFRVGQEASHIAGAIGECAAAKYFKLPWKPNVGVVTGIDVGEKIEVRTRQPASGRDLFVYPSDKDELPYVLAWLNDDQSIELVGWRFGHEAKGKGVWNEVGGIWFVPPPYRPLSELWELLK